MVHSRPSTISGAASSPPGRCGTSGDLLLRPVAFWNMVGAGLFGFMIKPADRSVLHAGSEYDSASRACRAVRLLRDAGDGPDAGVPPGAAAGCALAGRPAQVRLLVDDIGLFAMCVGSLLPVGLLQTWASVDKGYWYARKHRVSGKRR